MTTTTQAPATTTTARAAGTQPVHDHRARINWRTVAFATALIYGLGVPAALALHASTDPGVTTICIAGITVLEDTSPDGQITRTAPSDLPACHSPHAPEDK